ncbi:MAG TPA: hypothetical protein VH298_15010, partial [Jatrophihabitans sp.]|nr:hypothetical protein [Jatrophihabitans sp.]
AVQAAEPADSPRGQVHERVMTRLVTFARDTLEAWGVEECGLLECWPAADREVLELASRMLPRVRRYRLPEVLNNGLPVRAGQTWLSTRFHPHLFAAAAGASGLAVSLKADYYGTKHGSLIGQGSHWQFAEFDVLRTGPLPVPPMPAGGGFSAPVLAGYRQAKLEVAEQIYGGGHVEG